MIAVVPARIGSQRVPFKNLLEINNKPLFQLAIEFGLEMGFEVVCTSDSQIILDKAKKIGAIPFYSTTHSHTSTSEQIWKEITQEKSILLEPTSPMRQQQDIIKCLNHNIAATVHKVKTTEGTKYQYNGACYITDFSQPLLQEPTLVQTDFRVNIDYPHDLQLAQLLLHPPNPDTAA